MKKEELDKILKRVRPGMKLQLEFRKGHGPHQEIIEVTLNFLVFLRKMIDGRQLIARNKTVVVVMTAVAECRCWHYDEDRKCVLEVAKGFDKQHFSKVIGPDLQSLKIVK